MKIAFITSALILFAIAGYAQSAATQQKMQALLQKGSPGAKVALDKKTKIMDIEENGGGTIYHFQVPWSLVSNETSFRSPNLKDTAYTVDIKCTSGQSCINMTANNKPNRTKGIMLSFPTAKDSKAFSRMMNDLRKTTATKQTPHQKAP